MPWNSVVSLSVMLPTVQRMMLPRVLPGMAGMTLALTLAVPLRRPQRRPQRRKRTAVAFRWGAR